MDSINSKVYSDDSISKIKKYGGKTASLLHQYEYGNQKYLLPMTVVENVENVSKEICKSLGSVNMDLLFRSSVDGDESGYIGILRNEDSKLWREKNREEGSIKSTISLLLSNSTPRGTSSNFVANQIPIYRKFFDDGSEYEGLTSIIAMPKMNFGGFNSNSGSIIKHPNFEDKYVVSFGEGMHEYLVDKEGKVYKGSPRIEQYMIDRYNNRENNIFKRIVEMKNETDGAGFINGKLSQTEFGVCDIRSEDTFEKAYEHRGCFQYGNEFMYDRDEVYFLQQREFLDFSDYRLNEDEYQFNEFGDFPKGDFLDINHNEFVFNNMDLPKEDFILRVSTSFITGLCAAYHPFGKRLGISEENSKMLSIFNSPYLKGIEIDRQGTFAENATALGHGAYRVFMKGIPVKVV